MVVGNWAARVWHTATAGQWRQWGRLSLGRLDLGREEAPLRETLFSADQMAAHGLALARLHVLDPQRRPDQLLARLRANEEVLTGVGKLLAEAVAAELPITPAAEWLLDNLYLIEEEIRTARRHLPKGYSRELPRLAARSGDLESVGRPRVYELALQAIAHADGSLSRGTLTRFVAAYQSVQPLTLGELWAFPIMLRLALIENLRRVGVSVSLGRQDRDAADGWAQAMLEALELRSSDLILVIADMARAAPTLSSAFVAAFARRLQGQGAQLALPLTWVEQRLADQGQSIEQMVHLQSQSQAASQVSVANSIGSLRLLGSINWPEFVENLSNVEQTLRRDPSAVYEQMDFITRDAYRLAVERLARRSGRSELEVASHAVELAELAQQRLSDAQGLERQGHVGYYLLGNGRSALEQLLGLRVSRWRAQHPAWAMPLGAYVGAGLAGALLLAVGPFLKVALGALLPPWALVGLGLLLLLATWQLSLALLNWIVTLFVRPQVLPRMDYALGLPASARTLVVVPTMLGSPAGIEALLDGLELRFLANRDAQLQFALLTDLADAREEHRPEDAGLIALASAGISALNVRYAGSGGSAPFLLLHRPRRWNAQQAHWMGRERKRGKLADLNALLRGRADAGPGEAFSHLIGDRSALAAVRYVITLDTDTQLPRGSALQLAASMAHPLNRPRFGSGVQARRVVEGHAILQPRVGLSLPSTGRSGYARLHGGEPGIDPYTRAVSDVYQDLFDEGSFIGKGIYDVDAFEYALGEQLPDNRVLSHDLLEGCYARAGLLSDVQLMEEAPVRYGADAARRHRWIRGDWQLLGWLRKRLYLLPDKPLNPLSALSRWKLFDNLRRSLSPAVLMSLLLVGWLALPEPGMWTVRVLLIIGLVPLTAQLLDLLKRPLNLSGLNPRHVGVQPFGHQLLQLLQTLACLPHEAGYTLHAIALTLWRSVATKRNLLEWTASADVRQGAPAGSLRALGETAARMWLGPLAAALTGAALLRLRPEALPLAAPVLLLWLASPLLMWWLDRPLRARRPALSPAQQRYLRVMARRTWAFFDACVGAEDNHLPPDNLQEHPVPRIAHRTSPTNIGFALLANLTAHDLGYITLSQMLARIGATLDTLERLERHRGHFLNWYDTQTLEPLRPRYVSTVDSGNLMAQLLTLRGGLLTMADESLLKPSWCAGLADTYALLREALVESESTVPLAAFEQVLNRWCDTPIVTLAGLRNALESLHAACTELLAAVALQALTGEAKRWAQRLTLQCLAALDELADLLPDSGDLLEHPHLAGDATLRELAARSDASEAAQACLARLESLAARAGALCEMEQGFLYDGFRHQMVIGYNVDEHSADTGYYDLLASEARLGVFAAIALGQLPQESWFALGRQLSTVNGEPVLMSWSGSMFEYLMPMLLMPSDAHTLLDQSCMAAVGRQIEYGRERGVPWGISESGYNATDAALNYQYRAFGVPGLGLKRGLAEDLVVAPYASMMALLLEPVAACENLQRLQALGASGVYGFHEAVDFTPLRLPRGQSHAVVRSYMAHHQGMGLLAMAQVLRGPRMQQFFAADPRLLATLPLLHERVPKGVVPHAAAAERAALRSPASGSEVPVRCFTDPDTPAPEVHLLSNGSYHVMVTQAGGGYSRYRDMAVTRWREDSTCDASGSFCYLRDVDSGAVWSTAHQPTRSAGGHYQAIFSEGRAEFRRRDHGIETHTEIAVSPEDAIELKRVRIKNTSRATRQIEITSYAEVVLASAASDMQHPAFSKLFVQTELLPEAGALLCNRRPRASNDASPWMLQLLAVHGVRGSKGGAVSHETDRARFIGRGGSLQAPLALRQRGPLSNTAGSVLDPVAASRCVVTLGPDQSIIVDIVIGVADSRDGCLALVEKYRDRRLAERVFELAWTHSQVVQRQLNSSEAEVQLYARLASAVIFNQSALRADAAIIKQNRRGQSGLWGYTISGDLPIVLVQIGDIAQLELVRQLVQAHAWWRLKGLAVDLVVWNEERDIYRQQLHEQILGLVSAGVEAHVIDRPGGIFVRHAEQISYEDRVLLQSVARAVFSDQRGSLAEQLERGPRMERRSNNAGTARAGHERRQQPLVVSRAYRPQPGPLAIPNGDELTLFNGLGGFSADGRDYVIAPAPGQTTPAPWSNVLANPGFGSVISEAGAAYTWFENAHEFRLTPWHNDPVTDACGEAFYLRDEETGHVWSPSRADTTAACTTRHGFGCSRFERTLDGIASELEVFVAVDAAVKFSVLRLTNRSDRPRRLSATGYVEWVLGAVREATAPHLITSMSAEAGPLTVRNPYSNDYPEWVAFFDVDAQHHRAGSMTCDRAEFIGRNGSLDDPLALRSQRLLGRVGAALDPCAAIQVPLDLDPGETREIVFRLGAARNADEAQQLVHRMRLPGAAAIALQAVQRHWDEALGAVQVHTPDAALNQLANGWLVYQTLACRMWARSGYYQSGGAYGFRDQLQDAMALVHTRPALLREQLLLCAAHQFVEGDVQHWWHPPVGRGVRTHISDDYLWLPLGLSRYLECTGDRSILDESVPFLDGRAVAPQDESNFELPMRSSESGTLYQHARRALLHGLRLGEHGLPLMDGGDWNDGMNRVGHEGKGESVWLGFFLCEVLRQFAPLARSLDDDALAVRCEAERKKLAQQLEQHGWDGAWYRRAFFDNGAPLGSSESPECQIDSIAQSWAVLSGVAPPARARQAMDALAVRLVSPVQGLVKLLDPPFNGAGPDPGYIRGYVPGVRENGGQYTHGAIWAAMAFAELGDVQRAWQLLDIINPLNHGRTPAELNVYKVEPYVMAADVYSVAPHVGRGGWSWYTGSAGWMYRLIIEQLLGIHLEHRDGQAWLRLAPRLPAHWPGFKFSYRYLSSHYQVMVEQVETGTKAALTMDGQPQATISLPLRDDGLTHEALLRLPPNAGCIPRAKEDNRA